MAFAFVFPGQGSQSLNMMDGLLECPIVTDTFARAKDALGIDFLAMLKLDSSDEINQTIHTQPLMLTAGYATYLSYIEHGGKSPSILAGHSLGEWTALVASGVIDFCTALTLVKLRATAMQCAVPEDSGAMAAVIGLDDNKVVTICNQVAEELGLVVAPVNFNSPGQIVIAGDKAAVERAAIVLKDAGARMVKILPVSVPSHCSLMTPAAAKVKDALAMVKFNSPTIPVLHNFSTESYITPDSIKEALVKQLYMPVLWTDTINKIVSGGVSKIVECGPGKVLSGLNKRINQNILSYNLHNKEDITLVVAQLSE